MFSNLAATSTAGNSVCYGKATGAVGNITQTNGTTACGALSSLRYKYDVYSLDEESGLAEVMALRPVSYKYTPEFLGGFADDPNWSSTFVGFIAEEVQAVDPRLIALDNQGLPGAVQYDKITAVLAKAVQEQQAIIEENHNSVEEIKTTLGINSTGPVDLNVFELSQYFQNVWTLVTARLADTANAIERIVADRLQAREEICINDTCINEAQLQAIIIQMNAGGSSPAPVYDGCTDSAATNYNSAANNDDGSCEYPEDEDPEEPTPPDEDPETPPEDPEEE